MLFFFLIEKLNYYGSCCFSLFVLLETVETPLNHLLLTPAVVAFSPTDVSCVLSWLVSLSHHESSEQAHALGHNPLAGVRASPRHTSTQNCNPFPVDHLDVQHVQRTLWDLVQPQGLVEGETGTRWDASQSKEMKM